MSTPPPASRVNTEILGAVEKPLWSFIGDAVSYYIYNRTRMIHFDVEDAVEVVTPVWSWVEFDVLDM